MDCHLPAVPDDVVAAQRHQLAWPQPGADAEHHHGQCRGAFRRIALAQRRSPPLRPARPPSTAGALSRLQAASPAAPARRAPLRRAGTTPTGRCPGWKTRGRAGRPRRTPRSRHNPAGTPGWPGSPAPWRTGTARAPPCQPPACRRMPTAREHRIFPAKNSHALNTVPSARRETPPARRIGILSPWTTWPAATAIQAALGQIGFTLPGTITIRRTRCGKPRCACAASPPILHGPYTTGPAKPAPAPSPRPSPPKKPNGSAPTSPPTAACASSSPNWKPSPSNSPAAEPRQLSPAPTGDQPAERRDQAALTGRTRWPASRS